jgi:hypothetical protein
MACRALIDAWSHCDLTTIRALARQPWNRPLKFRHLTLRSNFSGELRLFDPRISSLTETLPLWRRKLGRGDVVDVRSTT